MICPKCGGGGRVGCTMCKGTGLYHEEDGITNEEWFCGLSIAEKSEFLAKMVEEAVRVHEKHGITWHEAVSWWDGWLKEKHNG